jgi:hypothetical protein
MINEINKLSKSTLSKEEILALNDKEKCLYHITYRGYFKELRRLIESPETKELIRPYIPKLSLIVAHTGNTRILKYLIKNNLLDVEIKNECYQNCFIFATYYGHIKVLKILVKYSNDIKDNNFIYSCCGNFNAFQYALYCQHIHLLDYLIQIGFRMYHNLYANYKYIVSWGKIKSLKYLDKKGYKVTNKEINKYLFDCCYNEILKYFYGKGGRLYGYKISKYINVLNKFNKEKFFINSTFINKLLFI